MIGWEDVYKVIAAMAPLYVALGLGYGSVKWWRMFKPDQCDAINRFNAYFIVPFFNLHFTAGVDPFHMNYRFLLGDVAAKTTVGVALLLWASLWGQTNPSGAITVFSIASMNNILVVGAPLLRAMHGPLGENLVVQSSVIQSLLWFPLLLFLLECRGAIDNSSKNSDPQPQGQSHSIEIVEIAAGANLHSTKATDDMPRKDPTTVMPTSEISIESPPSCTSTMKRAGAKLARNPNMYACALGLLWAFLAKRWNFEMPSIVDGSIQIMSTAGSGVAMFTMGLFMALQEKLIACGIRLTIYSMILRFVGGPLTMAVGARALNLHGNVVHIAIIQAALPHAINSFVFAQEYRLHASLLSTSIFLGTIISLPLLIAYSIVLDILH